MPFVNGGSLKGLLERSEGPLDFELVCRIAEQSARALSLAHQQGYAHRDINPANILVDEAREKVWIADFGIAEKWAGAAGGGDGKARGTLAYMSPEQVGGENVDERTDLFALGAVLYHAATGRPPSASAPRWPSNSTGTRWRISTSPARWSPRRCVTSTG